ncbi:MAG: tRNA lysidine(34) synthetase TilS [Pseudomonadota bacterium]
MPRLMHDDAELIGEDEANELFGMLEGRRLTLCVSGGPDSMALMFLVARWMQARGPQLISDVWLDVVTVDHSLRPGSAGEAAFVARHAADLGLAHQTLTWVPDDQMDSGLQEAARNARRYLLARHALREYSAHGEVDDRDHDGFSRPSDTSVPRTLVMAHHLEDQAETVLMRLARGSGADGLMGMQAMDRIALNLWADGRPLPDVPLARPLLDLPRARLLAYLQCLGVGYVQDASNTNTDFERVRFRKALAILDGLGMRADKIALSARRLGELRAFASADRLRDMALFEGSREERLDLRNGLFATCGFARFASAETRFAGIAILRDLLRAFGGGARDADLADVEALFDWLLVAGPGAGKTLGGCKIELVGGAGKVCRVYREVGRVAFPVRSVAPGEIAHWDGGRFSVEVSRSAISDGVVGPLGDAGWTQLRRSIPEIERLKLPAAAMATMPVVRRDGALWACPVLHRYLMTLPPELKSITMAWRGSIFSGLKGFRLRAARPFAEGYDLRLA